MQLKDNAIAMAITVAWLDAAGKTAKVQDGSLKVVSSDPNLVTVEGDAANGFTVKPGPLTGVDGDDNGILGTAQITATADADLGDGVTEVAAVGAITVVTSDAVVGTLSIGGQPA